MTWEVTSDQSLRTKYLLRDFAMLNIQYPDLEREVISDQYSNRRLLSIVNRHWSVGRGDNEERGTKNAEREGSDQSFELPLLAVAGPGDSGSAELIISDQ